MIILVLAVLSTWTYDISRLTHLDAFTIQTVDIEGSDDNMTGLLTAAAFNAIQGDYLGLFSKSNALLYPKTAIEESIKKASPRIDFVSVGGSGLQSLVIIVHEKTPAALVCMNLPDFNSNAFANLSDSCYFADHAGMLYTPADMSSGRSYNRYYVSDGSYAIASSTFKSLQNFYDGLRSARIEPRGILVKGDDEYELYAANPVLDGRNGTSLPISDTVVIYFNENNGFENELSNLISFWSHSVMTAQAKNEPLSFDSIDLRYGSNVSYRLSK